MTIIRDIARPIDQRFFISRPPERSSLAIREFLMRNAEPDPKATSLSADYFIIAT